MLSEKNVHDLFEWYKNIENRLMNIIEYTPFQSLNESKDIVSPRCVSIIVESASIIDSLFRTMFPEEIIRSNGKKITSRGANIYDFYNYFEENMKLTETESIYLGSEPFIVSPFNGWGSKYPESPKWWNAYNHLKHNRLLFNKDGSVYNSIMSICALHQVMSKIPEVLKYSFRYNWIKFSGFNPSIVFEMITKPNNCNFLAYTQFFCTLLKPANWTEINNIKPATYDNSTKLVEYLGRIL